MFGFTFKVTTEAQRKAEIVLISRFETLVSTAIGSGNMEHMDMVFSFGVFKLQQVAVSNRARIAFSLGRLMKAMEKSDDEIKDFGKNMFR